jgi:hypothetical protein
MSAASRAKDSKSLTYLVANGAAMSVVETHIFLVSCHRLSKPYQYPQ